uniref:uncharacterized protein LOC120811137 isoform X2 n=1 Tax=Gasterosteus aculeatus aculeatus TaxID=481459 RepID=UPI001A99137F|nr:uncharacterized protein LOC120811137 isoform X2 [Gasterosteus aculeatus aculeatus]
MLVNFRIPSLDQMKLISLIDYTLILIVASNSEGESWNIDVSRHINATLGSNVTIQCHFTVPTKHYTESMQVFWKKDEKSKFNTFDNDKNAFIFHPNETFVLEKYRGKTRLMGNKSAGNCSLKIFNIRDNVPNIYVRLIAKGDNYSFSQNSVSIAVTGTTQLTPITQGQPVGADPENDLLKHVSISVPVVAILTIIVVVGIVLGIKHKRSASFIREDSRYYANFSRANQLQREASCQKPENSKVSEQKDIEEPVYANIEAHPDQMDQSADHLDNIYANVDHLKL